MFGVKLSWLYMWIIFFLGIIWQSFNEIIKEWWLSFLFTMVIALIFVMFAGFTEETFKKELVK